MRRGFNLIEILMGVAILSFGIIPLLWALHGGTIQTRLTLRQVQGSNHASNLLEALRATPYQDLARFPVCMTQIYGGDDLWRRSGDAPDIEYIMPEVIAQPESPDAGQVFDKFRSAFFSGDFPIVPHLDSTFSRYFIILKDKEKTPAYITLIVRVEWKTKNALSTPGDKKKNRSVELRTVLADPYFFEG